MLRLTVIVALSAVGKLTVRNSTNTTPAALDGAAERIYLLLLDEI